MKKGYIIKDEYKDYEVVLTNNVSQLQVSDHESHSNYIIYYHELTDIIAITDIFS